MNRIKKIYLFLALSAVVSSSCNSTKNIPRGTVINQPNLLWYLNKGDKVKVTTLDSIIYNLEISSIDDTFLLGSNQIKVPYSSIEQIETTFGTMSVNQVDTASVSQVERAVLNPKYKTRIIKTDNTRLKGIMYDVQDTNIRISDWNKSKPYYLYQFNYQKIDAVKINSISLNRKRRVSLGAAVGGIGGFLYGTIAGATHDGYVPPLAGGFIVGMVGAGVGAGVGALFGLFRVKLSINGNLKEYQANLPRLKNYSYLK